jgi:hypothetical protein
MISYIGTYIKLSLYRVTVYSGFCLDRFHYITLTVIIPPLPLFDLCPSVHPSIRPSFRPSVLPSVQDIFRHIFLSNCWWQKSDIWSQASYRYTILWVAFLDPSDSYFLFTDLVGFYTHWTFMHIFRHIFLSNYWWQKSDIWSQASYRYHISCEVFLTRQIPTSCLPKSRCIISEH